MKWTLALIVGFMIASAPNAVADDSGKLDQILRELRELKQRVIHLERRLEASERTRLKPVDITVEKNWIPSKVRIETVPGLQRRPFDAPSPRVLNRDVEEVIRQQFESPGSLLRDVHGLEQKLRRRIFAPELRAPTLSK